MIKNKKTKLCFCKGVKHSSVKKLKFVYFLSLGTFGLEKLFGCFLDRKIVFLDHKDLDINKSQNLHFFKGFGRNLEFRLLFLSKLFFEKVFGDILCRKLAFLHYKNTDLKKLPNLHVCKGVSPWFLPKLWKFLHCVFVGTFGLEKNVLWRSRLKN